MSTTRDPYDNPGMPTNEPAKREGLSTADMAAAADRQQTQATARNDQMNRGEAAKMDSTLSEPTEQHDSTARSTDRPVSNAVIAGPPRPAGMQATGNGGRPGALLAPDDMNGFRSRWDSVQTGFVDQPRQAVEQADALVAEVMQRLAQTFADERAKLENAWSRGDNVSTEDLRVALQRYRSFFDRLLSI